MIAKLKFFSFQYPNYRVIVISLPSSFVSKRDPIKRL